MVHRSVAHGDGRSVGFRISRTGTDGCVPASVAGTHGFLQELESAAHETQKIQGEAQARPCGIYGKSIVLRYCMGRKVFGDMM